MTYAITMDEERETPCWQCTKASKKDSFMAGCRNIQVKELQYVFCLKVDFFF